MLLTSILPVLLLLNWASIKHAKPSFFPHTFPHDAFFIGTPFENERHLFLSPSPNFSSRASSFRCTHSNFVSRFLSTHSNFVWSLDSTTSAMLDVNSWPWKSMSSLAHIWGKYKENNLNQNTVKRSEQRNYQPVIRAAFLSSWVRRRKGGPGWITWSLWGRCSPNSWHSCLFSSSNIRLLIIRWS